MQEADPKALNRVAAEPGVDELIVIILPEDPIAMNVPAMVWVVSEVNVTVFGAFIVKLFQELLPCIITAPAPLPVIEISLYVFPPPAKVLLVALVSLIIIVEVLGVTVRLVVVAVFHTVPVPDRVHVPEPMVMALVYGFDDEKLAIDKL